MNYKDIHDAIDALSSVCDGAITKDNVGFSAQDTHVGKYMATVPASEWTPAMARSAWELLLKYRVQLENHGIDYDDLQEPADTDENGREQARTAFRSLSERELRNVTLVNDTFILYFPYNKDIVADLKDTIPWSGRTFDGDAKTWLVRQVEGEKLRPFLDRHGFGMSPEASLALEHSRGADAPAGGSGAREGNGGARKRNRVASAGGGYDVWFDYSPAAVVRIKQVPGARFNPTARNWHVPKASLIELYQCATSLKLHVPDDIRDKAVGATQQASAALEASRAAEADLEVDALGGTLHPFQRAGVAYATKARRCFIADEMGLGKTIQALATLEKTNAYPALVVCPASVKIQWAKEATKWLLNRRTFIVNGKRPFALVMADIYVINYDVLSSWVANFDGIRAIILDESHYIKNPRAQRTKAALELAADLGIVLLLTGTPVLNRPIELLPQLQCLRRLDDEFGGKQAFRSRYCWDQEAYAYVGARNLDELNTRLRRSCYVRRTKDEVASELPSKGRHYLHLQGSTSEMEAYRAAEEDIYSYFRLEAARISAERGCQVDQAFDTPEWKSSEADHLVRIGTLRKLSAKAKIKETNEWIGNLIDTGEQLVVFAHHREIVGASAVPFDAPVIIGGDKAKDRDKAISDFKAGKHQVIVCSIQAAGMGIDGLQVASHALFIEQAWTPSVLEQAEDRIHRMGQKRPAFIWYAHLEGTIDDYIFRMLKEKRKVIEGTIQGTAGSAATNVIRSIVKEMINGR